MRSEVEHSLMANDAPTLGAAREAHQHWVLVGLVGLALFLRLWLLHLVPVIETDGVRYVEIARRFQQTGSPFDSLFHPLYPLCIALFQVLVPDYELAGRLASSVFGAVLILPAYALTRALLGSRVAALTGVLLAIHPALLHGSIAVLSETTYTFWIVLGVWAGWHGLSSSRPGSLAAAGLCFGLAYLTRPEGFLYLVGLLLLTAWTGIRDKRLRILAPWGGAGLVGFLLLAGPYLIYLRNSLGYWTLSGKVMHNLLQDTGGGAVVGQTDMGFLLSHAGAMARRVLENAYLFEKYALPDLFPGLLVLAVLPGLLHRPRGSDWGASQGLLLAAALPPFATLAFHVEARVFLPSLPFLLPMAATGVLAAAKWCARDRTSTVWTTGLAALFVLALLPFSLRLALHPDPGAALYRQAAGWVAATQPADVTIMDRKPFIAFYTGRRLAILPRVPPGELASAAGRAGAKLVILDSRVFADRPELFPLLYALPPAGLTVLQDFDAGPDGRLRILKVGDRG